MLPEIHFGWPPCVVTMPGIAPPRRGIKYSGHRPPNAGSLEPRCMFGCFSTACARLSVGDNGGEEMSLASLLGLGPGERGSLGGKSLPQYMNSLQNFLTVVPAPPRNRRLRGNSYLTPR